MSSREEETGGSFDMLDTYTATNIFDLCECYTYPLMLVSTVWYNANKGKLHKDDCVNFLLDAVITCLSNNHHVLLAWILDNHKISGFSSYFRKIHLQKTKCDCKMNELYDIYFFRFFSTSTNSLLLAMSAFSESVDLMDVVYNRMPSIEIRHQTCILRIASLGKHTTILDWAVLKGFPMSNIFLQEFIVNSNEEPVLTWVAKRKELSLSGKYMLVTKCCTELSPDILYKVLSILLAKKNFKRTVSWKKICQWISDACRCLLFQNADVLRYVFAKTEPFQSFNAEHALTSFEYNLWLYDRFFIYELRNKLILHEIEHENLRNIYTIYNYFSLSAAEKKLLEMFLEENQRVPA